MDFDEYLANVDQKTAIELFEEKVQRYLNEHYPGRSLKDISLRERSKIKPTSILPSQPTMYLPFGKTLSAEVPVIAEVKVSFNKSDGSLLMEKAVSLPEIAGKRFCLDFIPASSTDAQIIAGYGGMCKTPPGAAQLKPVLKLDGRIIQVGVSVKTGDSFYPVIDGVVKLTQPVGVFMLIAFDAFSASAETIQKAKEELKDIPATTAFNDLTREEYLGRVAEVLATTYLLRVYEAIKRANEILHCYQYFSDTAFFPTILYTFPDQIQKEDDAKFLIYSKWNIDSMFLVSAIGRGENPGSYIGPDELFSNPLSLFLMKLYMFDGSYNEGRIFEDWQDTPGASTVKGIMLAREQGIPVVTLTKVDIVNDHLAVLENETQDRLEDSVIQAIIKELKDGQTVTLPVRKVRYQDMVFWVYMSIGPKGIGMMFNYDHGGASSTIVIPNNAIAPPVAVIPPQQTTTIVNSDGNGNNMQTNTQAAVKSMAGDPVNLVTGEFEHEETPDFDIKSRGVKLDITRKYRSQLIYNGPFGYGWAWNHSERLLIGTNGDLVYYNAERIPYYLTVNSDGTYQYPAGTTFIMKKNDNEYLLSERDTSKIYFSSAGLLVKKEDPNGNVLIFEYDSENKLIRLNDPLGRYLAFNYNVSGKITQISDFLGRSCFYDYDGDDLISFTDLDGKVYSYEYLKYGEQTPLPASGSYDSTKLLLYCDGVNGSNNFRDELGHAVFANGDVKIDTSNSKFGGASVVFDGNGDYLTIPDSEDWNFGTGDFTIDFWARINSPGSMVLCGQAEYVPPGGNPSRQSRSVEIWFSGTTVRALVFYNGTGYQDMFGTSTLSTGVWYHIAFVRDGNYGTIYVNGMPENTMDLSGVSINNSISVFGIGSLGAASDYRMNGWIDEFRISKGLARWTSNFVPPTEQFRISQDIPTLTVQENPANGHNMCKYTLPNGDFLDIGYYKDDTVSYHRNKKGEVFSFQYSRLNRYAEIWNEEGYYRKVFYNENHDVTRITTREKTVELMSYDSRHNLISRTDANGWKTTFSYDSRRNLLSQTNALDEVTRYEYHPVFNKPTRIIDPNGGQTLFEYDDYGNLIKVTDALGKITEYDYDPYGNLVRITDSLGYTQETTYDSAGLNPVEVKDKNGNRFTCQYDQAGNLIAQTDPLGFRTSYEYNNYNQRVKVTDALEKVTEYEYDSNRLLTRLIEANGAVTQNIYDTTRDMVSGAKIKEIIDPLENKEVFEYDKLGNMISRMDKNGYITLFKYDEMSRLFETIDPFRNTLRTAYDGNGNVVGITDKRGFITEYTYDAANRRISASDPDKNKTVYEYDKNGNPIKETNALGVVTKYEYDQMNRMIKKTLGYGLLQPRIYSFEYDDLGRSKKNTDPLGNYYLYEYDPNGNRIKEAFFDSVGTQITVTSYFYDSRNLLIKKIDPNGNAWKYEYDKLKRKTAEIDPLGDRIEYAYDLVGNIRGIKDQLENITAYTYNLRKEKITETNPFGHSKQFSYDAQGNLISVTDELGFTTQYGYDSLNRKIAVTNALDQTNTIDYDENGNIISTSDHRLNRYRYEYNKNNLLEKKIEPEGYWVLGYEYDALSRITKSYDGRGVPTTTEYDALGNVIKVAQAAGLLEEAITQFEYDVFGNKVKEINPLGSLTNYEYDKRNLLIKKTLVGESGLENMIFVYEYDANGNLTKAIDPKGKAVIYTYNKLGRKISQSDTEGNIFTWEYDKRGDVISETSPEGKLITYAYDAMRRRTMITQDRSKRAFSYNERGDITHDTNMYFYRGEIWDGVATMYQYDALGRVSYKSEGATMTNFVYDASGNLKEVSLRKDLVQGTFFERVADYYYDQRNLCVTEYDADDSVMQHSYDGNHNLVWTRKRNGLDVTKTYDALERLTKVSAGGQTEQEFIYDKLSRMVKAIDYNSGKVTNTVEFEYDCFNRVTAEIQNGKRLDKRYDLNSNPVKLSYPSGKVIEKAYVPQNLARDIWYQNAKIVSLQYDKDSRPKTSAFACGIAQNLAYNPMGLEELRKYTQGAAVLFGEASSYYYQGNIFQEVIERNNSQITKIYFYDSQDRVIHEASVLRDNTWGYDVGSNIISTNQNGYSEARVVNPDNEYTQINSVPAAYDANGNLVSYSGKEYAYDWADRLIQVKQASISLASYTYDALNRRVTKFTAVDSQKRTFVHDGNQVIEEYSSTVGGLDKVYVYADYIDDPILMESGGQRYCYLKDRQYNIVALVDTSGTVVERYDYSAYGISTVYNGSGAVIPKSAIGNFYGYTGRYFDAESGLWYYRNRMYSPQLGRFLQRDPKGYVDGLNLYAYVKNNPLRYLDPMGLTAREQRKFWYDLLWSWTDEQAEVAKEFYIGKLATDPMGVAAATVINTAIDVGAGTLAVPSAIGHLGEGTGTFSVSPSWETAPGILMDVSLAASIGSSVAGVLPSARQPIVVSPKPTPQVSAIPPPVETTKEARYVYEAATRNYRDLKTGQFVKQQDLPYPSNSGFESWNKETLQVGTTIDRYGKTSGRYAGQPGATISQRGMPPGSENLPYSQFEVVKPIENVKVGPAASVPEFVAEGGAKQYYLPKSFDDLMTEYLMAKK